MRLRYGYTVDGGLVPSHHQAHHVDINHDLEDGRITIGLNERFDSVDEAQKELLTRYDRVILDFVQSTSTKDLNLKYNKPFIFGVLTTDNQQQALDRAGGKHGNKGDEAAITAIKMVELKKSFQ
jgi:hypothetical protein